MSSDEGDKPLQLEWCCGINHEIDTIDLSLPDRPQTVAFAANHLVVIQETEKGEHFPLAGHRNNVTCLSSSPCKRFIASGDKGLSPCVIIWDVQTRDGLQCIDNANSPVFDEGIAAITFSPDSKLLIILSSDSVLSIWRWMSPSSGVENEPYLYRTYSLDEPLSFVNKPNLACHNYEKSLLLLVTIPQATLFYTLTEKEEEINIEGEKSIRATFSITEEKAVPDEEEIGTLRADWQFGKSCFLSHLEAITYFSKGSGAILLSRRQDQNSQWKHAKMLKFSERPITSIQTYQVKGKIVLVVSDSSGHIRFLSRSMKLLYWLKRPMLSGLSTISFSFRPLEKLADEAEGLDASLEASEFYAPPFTAVTTSGCIYVVENGTPKLVYEGPPSGNLSIIAHPERNLIAVAGTNEIRLMDTTKFNSIFLSKLPMNNEEITKIVFSQSGAEICVGCKSGVLYQIDTYSLKTLSTLNPCSDEVVDIVYSPSGLILASADSCYAVTVYTRDNVANNKWRQRGRFRPHTNDICQLLFISEYGVERLLSISKDRKLVEYGIEEQLRIISQYRIEQDAIPTCLIVHPTETGEENFLLTANNHFKLRLFNQTTKLPRRITRAGKYDTPIKRLISRPCNLPVLAFSTNTSLGIILLPIDGNSNREYAVLGNPDGLTGIAAGLSSLMTCGRGIISSWKISEESLIKHNIRGGVGMAPFYSSLQEEEFKLLQDVFYFCQLEAQGLERQTKRDVKRTIPLEKVPDAVRALGWYPSELQIEELLTEVKFSQYHKTQKQVEEVDLDDFIKLYINHRPVESASQEDVDEAFATLGGSMNPGELMHTIENYGEKMSSKEFANCLEQLCGTNGFADLLHISPTDFTEKILQLSK